MFGRPRKQMVRILRYTLFDEMHQLREAGCEDGAIKKAEQKGSVPRAGIELATHGSSGHVPSDSRNLADKTAR